MYELIQAGESLEIEFKRANQKHPLADKDLVETVTCLANANGGFLLLGVEDDGYISGFEPRKISRSARKSSAA